MCRWDPHRAHRTRPACESAVKLLVGSIGAATVEVSRTRLYSPGHVFGSKETVHKLQQGLRPSRPALSSAGLNAGETCERSVKNGAASSSPPRTWHRSGYRTARPEYAQSHASCRCDWLWACGLELGAWLGSTQTGSVVAFTTVSGWARMCITASPFEPGGLSSCCSN